MNAGTKVALIGGLAALGAGAAYYFFIYRKSTNTAQSAIATINQAVDLTTVKKNNFDGRLLRGGQDPKVYLIKDGYKHWFTSPSALLNKGYLFNQVESVDLAVLDTIPTGSSISGLNGIDNKKLLMS